MPVNMRDPADREALRGLLNEVLEERSRIDSETHREHHAFIEALIKRDQAKTEMFEKIRGQIIQWGVIGVISGAGTLLWNWFSSELPALPRK